MSHVDKLLANKSPEYLQVAALLKDMPRPPNRSHIKPICRKKVYRGKLQQVVGYEWSRPTSTFYGRVYDCILGAGEDFSAAFEKAERKIAALKAGLEDGK